MTDSINLFRTAPWQISYLFDLGMQSWLIHIGVVLLTGTLLIYGNPDATWPYIWVSVMLALSFSMSALCYLCSPKFNRPNANLIHAGWAHSILTTLVGLTWGYGAVLVAMTGAFNLLAIYSLALGGTALGAVSSQHAVPRSALISVWTSIPLLSLSHLTEFRGLHLGMMVLLYGFILSILTVRMHRFLSTNYNLAQSLNIKVSELTETTSLLESARREADHANLSKSRFLAHASHDLRQPIHAIGLLVASLKDTKLNNEQKQMLDSIEQSVDSVTRLFASLLDISRLDVGGVKPRPEPVNLGMFLDRIFAQNRDLAAKNGCSICYVRTDLWVHTDADLLLTMMQNVLGNAFKYASGSRVLFGPRRINGKLALQVCDTGPGIEAKELDDVFNEFYRLDSAGFGRNIEGMGLGLAIVRGLGDLMGLQVMLSSIPGRGTSVLITGFEYAIQPTEPTQIQKHAHPLSGKRICLIDDDETVRLATTRLLERWGCRVSAFSGVEAISGRFDAILTDLELGNGKTGLDVVAALNVYAKHPVPAIILTGYDGDTTQEQIAGSGLPVLQKPVRPAELRAILTRLCLGL